MKESSTDVARILQQLAHATDVMDRLDAARALGALASSSEEIIRALVCSEETDPYANVRSAAGKALQAPIHQAFLTGHPGLADQAARLAAQAREQMEQSEHESITEEFLRRRRIARVLALLPSVVAFLYCGMLVLLMERIQWAYQISTLLIFIAMGVVLWLSWKTWRCPACDSWLGSIKAQVNPFFSRSPTWCPHCGKKLM